MQLTARARRRSVGQNWEVSKCLAAAPETATAPSASRIGAPQCPCWRPAGVLLATACAMAWRLAWLCVAVHGRAGLHGDDMPMGQGSAAGPYVAPEHLQHDGMP